MQKGIAMKAFSRLKNIRKGIEGAILTGGAVEVAIQALEKSESIDVTKVEHAATVLIVAGIGFVFKSLTNWLKNRGK